MEEFYMKVENNGLNRVNRPQAEGAQPVEKEVRSPEHGRLDSLNGKDQANFSERARLLSKARASLEETPDVRAEKVSTLQEQVESGAYQVPFEALARKLQAQLRLEG
jgi:flagellar biosynthesis anti-sigma factor FlgM